MRGRLADPQSLVLTGQGKAVSVCCPLLPHHPIPHHTHFLASLGQMLGADIGAWPVEVSDQARLEQADGRSRPRAEAQAGSPSLRALPARRVRDPAPAPDADETWALGRCFPGGRGLPSASTASEGFIEASAGNPRHGMQAPSREGTRCWRHMLAKEAWNSPRPSEPRLAMGCGHLEERECSGARLGWEVPKD